MSDPLSPYEVCEIAANDRAARFEVTITGTIEAFEMDSLESVKITIAEQKLCLHWRTMRDFSGPILNGAIEVRRIDV